MTGRSQKPETDDSYTEQETVARREAALQRMLATPHKPHEPIGKRKASPKPEKRTAGKGRARVGKGRS